MSLLLDALRKSEAQRRRGQAPSLDLSAAVPSDETRRIPLRAWIAMSAALLVAAVALWSWHAGWLAGERKAGSDPAAPVPVAESNVPVSGSPGSGAAPGAIDSAPKPASGANPDAGVDQDHAAGTASPLPDPVAEDPGRVADARSAPGADTAEGDAGADSGGEAAPEEPASEPESGRATEREPVAGTVAAPDAARADSTGTEPGAGGSGSRNPGEGLANYVQPWELPRAQRARFPELDLTVHFYATKPEDRFVLINGERYAEGDRVADGALVHTIRRGGVLIEFGDYLVLIE